ncbi:uncharacterized protein LOC108100237 [Drosophila ficusphila]|uniref:uncharacterized protein LOC108100237 n=1 Tax=Drosophila ficusphila TaxID=30025 RepID=UPI0007E83539|nr:uncharacterized protein LOC108100237 [Drosophila ficusphila]
MSVEEATLNLPAQVINLTIEKQVLLERLEKIQDILKLLENRDEGQTCTVSAGNVYQVTTVKNLRVFLAINRSVTISYFVKADRKLLQLQQNMNQSLVNTNNRTETSY